MPSALPKLDPCTWLTWSLPFIGDDAAHKVRVGGLQVGHELIQILLGVDESGESGATGTIFLGPGPLSLSPEFSRGPRVDMSFMM